MKFIEHLILSGELWRYFIDVPKQHKGRIGFEERGYTTALMEAVTLFPRYQHNQLSLKMLLDFHQAAMNGVGDSRSECGTPGEICKAVMEFGLGEHNSSEAGMLELLKDIQTRGNLNYYVATGSGIHDRVDLPKLNDSELSDLAKGLCDRPGVMLRTSEREMTQNYLISAISRFKEEIQVARCQDKKLRAIAKLCREGARLHPFADGNGRVFCMLLPYFLCLKYVGFIPLMLDVNHFGNFSLDELVQEMKSGRGRTNALLKKQYDAAGVPEDYPTSFEDEDSYVRATFSALKSFSSGFRWESARFAYDFAEGFQRLYKQDLLTKLVCHYARCSQWDNLFELLNKESFLIHATTRNGENLLHIAVYYGDLSIIERLVADGCRISQCNKNGESPIIWSLEHRRFDIAEYFFETLPADELASIKNSFSRTLLHRVCALNADISGFVKILLEKGVDADAKDSNRLTALDVYLGRVVEDEQVAALIKRMSAEALNDCGEGALYPLICLAQRKLWVSLSALIDREGIDFGVANHHGETALSLLLKSRELTDTEFDLAEKLIGKMSPDDLNKGSNGDTPLHLLLQKLDTVRCDTQKTRLKKLIDLIMNKTGVDYTCQNTQHQTPLSLMFKTKDLALIKAAFKKMSHGQFLEENFGESITPETIHRMLVLIKYIESKPCKTPAVFNAEKMLKAIVENPSCSLGYFRHAMTYTSGFFAFFKGTQGRDAIRQGHQTEYPQINLFKTSP